MAIIILIKKVYENIHQEAFLTKPYSEKRHNFGKQSLLINCISKHNILAGKRYTVQF